MTITGQVEGAEVLLVYIVIGARGDRDSCVGLGFTEGGLGAWSTGLPDKLKWLYARSHERW